MGVKTNTGAVNVGMDTGCAGLESVAELGSNDDAGEGDEGVDGPALTLGSIFLIHAPIEPLCWGQHRQVGSGVGRTGTLRDGETWRAWIPCSRTGSRTRV